MKIEHKFEIGLKYLHSFFIIENEKIITKYRILKLVDISHIHHYKPAIRLKFENENSTHEWYHFNEDDFCASSNSFGIIEI